LRTQQHQVLSPMVTMIFGLKDLAILTMLQQAVVYQRMVCGCNLAPPKFIVAGFLGQLQILAVLEHLFKKLRQVKKENQIFLGKQNVR